LFGIQIGKLRLQDASPGGKVPVSSVPSGVLSAQAARAILKEL
jgi:hypothetical protein